MRAILPLVCLFLFKSLCAQSAYIDSLQTEISKSREDTNRVKLVLELAYQLRATQPDSSLKLTISGGKLAHELDFYKGKFGALRIRGIAHYYNRQLDTALYYFKQARELAEGNNDTYNLSNIFNNIATVYRGQAKRKLALEFYEKSFSLKKELGDVSGQVVALNNIGLIHKVMDDFEEAMNHFERALELQHGLGNKAFEAGILQNIALIHRSQHHLEEAILFYERVLEISISTEDQLGEANALLAMGRIYIDDGNFVKALSCLQQSVDIRGKLGNKNKQADGLDYISDLYVEMKDYTQALEYAQKSLELREELGNKGDQTKSLTGIGRILLQQQKYPEALTALRKAVRLRKEAKHGIGSFIPLLYIGTIYEKQNQLDSALFYLKRPATSKSESIQSLNAKTNALIALARVYNKQGDVNKTRESLMESLDLARELSLKSEQAEATKLLYQLYKKQNNYSEALRYYEIHTSIQDSLFNEESIQKITRLEAENEFEQEKQKLAYEQEKQLVQYNADLGRQRNLQLLMGGALLIALILIFIIVRFYRLKREANLELTRLNEEIKQQKIVVEQQKDDLLELDKMKSQFFTNISHEFRTPLTIILGMITQVKDDPDKWLDRGSELIKRNSQQLLSLINQILDLRKLEANTLQLHLIHGDIVGYVQHIVDSFIPIAESNNIIIHFLPITETLYMDYDQEKMMQVFSNLLSNSIKYMNEEGGDIYVYADQKKVNLENVLSVQVKDTGKGIPEEALPRIFDRFYQVQSDDQHKPQGSGVGLSLTKELVKLMDGKIEVESRVGEGTKFILNFPIRKKTSLTAVSAPQLEGNILLAPSITEATAEASTKQSSNLPTLLIVEDNLDIQIYLRSCLEKHYHLLIANDGEEGIEMAIAHVPELIISDVMMPKKDGFEVCDTLKNHELTSHIPIIILTAKSSFESKLSGLKKGADAYLLKPFESEELIVRLEQLFILRQKLQQRYSKVAALEEVYVSEAHKVEDEFLQKIRQILLDNISEDNFNSQRLSREMGIGRTQLHNKLKALTGQSTSAFMKSVKLHKAKELLQTTDLNVSEVSYEIGIGNPFYFSRIYKEMFGVSPKEEKKKV